MKICKPSLCNIYQSFKPRFKLQDCISKITIKDQNSPVVKMFLKVVGGGKR